MKSAMAFCVLVSASGCATEAAQCCLVRTTVPIAEPAPHPPPSHDEYVETATPVAVLPAPNVLVLQSSHIDRLTEVIGVVDVHSEMGGHDAALDLLKRRAAELGADAVLGVEFHHGHGEEEPTHLSGLAVRFVEQVR
jgi:hypothetical protein